MKITLITFKMLVLFIFTCVTSNLFSQQIEVRTTSSFTCTTNAECKRKCEALGSDHTWKPRPGGPIHGTCTKRSEPLAGGNKIKSVPGTHGIFVETEENNNAFKKKKLKFISQLMKSKKWNKEDVSNPSVPLSILECEALGGTVQYHSDCGTTLLKCSNRGYAACITETKR